MRVDAGERAQERARLAPHGRRLGRALPQVPHKWHQHLWSGRVRQPVLAHKRQAEAEQHVGVGGRRPLERREAGGPALVPLRQAEDPCIRFRHRLVRQRRREHRARLQKARCDCWVGGRYRRRWSRRGGHRPCLRLHLREGARVGHGQRRLKHRTSDPVSGRVMRTPS